MIFRITIILFFLLNTTSYAYSDYDIDGVEDSIDECPNTPFDILVDENGCQEGKTYKGEVTLLAGTISSIDKNRDTLTNLIFSANYSYYDLDISISSLNEISNTTSESSNPLYINSGYKIKLSNNLQTRAYVGVKTATEKNDYYIGTYFNYNIDKTKDIFVLYSYTLSGDTKTQNYGNYSTLSLGGGKIVFKNWYSSLSYDFSQKNIKNGEDYKAISWSNTVAITTKYFILTNYSYGLNNGASAHTINLQFGVKFE